MTLATDITNATGDLPGILNDHAEAINLNSDAIGNLNLNLVGLGADNTGVADVIPILTAAAATGIPIDVPDGDYLCLSQFVTSVPTTIRCGQGATFIAGFTEASQLGLFHPGDDFQMTGGTIDGAATTAPFGAKFGIYISGLRNKLQDVKVKNTRNAGVYSAGASDPIYINVTTENCGTSEFPLTAGFFSSNSGPIRFDHCTSTGSQAQGFYVDGQGEGVAILTGCSAYGNGVGATPGYGIDIRQEATVTGCVAKGNVKGGLSVALTTTGVPNHGVSIVGGDFSNNGPCVLADAAEVSISNTTHVTMAGTIIESDSLDVGVSVAGVVGAAFSGVRVMGSHAGYTYGYKVGKLGSTRSVGVDISGGKVMSSAATGSLIIMTDSDRITVSGGSLAGAAVDVQFAGTCNDCDINPSTWLRRVSGVATAPTYTGGRRVVAPHVLGILPVSGAWTRGFAIDNVNAAVAAPKGWVCTVAGGSSTGTWAATTAYALGIWYQTSTGVVMEVTTAGTTSGSEPNPTTVGQVVVDGTVTWTCRALTAATFVSTGNL